jgi:hypothetical protein
MKILVWLTAAACLLTGCGRHPTDANLQASFRKHSVTLTNIVAALQTSPNVERIDWNGATLVVNSAQTNPPALTTILAPHFKLLGQPLVVLSMGGGGQVWFYYSSRGLSVSGSARGVVYTQKTPPFIVPDTDVAPRTNSTMGVYRHLDTNWFIFYEW